MKPMSFRFALLALLVLPGVVAAGHGHAPPPGGYVVSCASIDHRDRYCPADTRGGHGYGGGYGPRVVRCESVDHRPRFCHVPGGVRDVRLDRRLSKAGCEFGYSWGFRRDGVWVERGCRADFVVF